MRALLTRSHLLILPLVILTVVLAEEWMLYELRQHVPSAIIRTAAVMLLYGPGIALFSALTTSRLKKGLVHVRSQSRRLGGAGGILTFLAVGYGLLFYAYYQLEVGGPDALFRF